MIAETKDEQFSIIAGAGFYVVPSRRTML